MRLLSLIVLATTSVALPSTAHALRPDPGQGQELIYRWRDAAGRLHFSNRADRVPASATALNLAPVAIEAARSQPAIEKAETVLPRALPGRAVDECPDADESGLVAAVAERLARRRQLEGLTLLVASAPVAHSAGAIVTRVAPRERVPDVAATEQGAIAYPADGACPTRPPLPRYAVGNGQHGKTSGLCEDYRRAFAQVGVAASRDQGVARSFRKVAEDFVAIAGRSYLARSPETTVVLPPWVVEAHVAQADEIAAETSAFVDELSVALGEIDRAARARGCW